MLKVALLRSGDRTIAIDYGFQRDGVQYHYATGFDPDPELKHCGLGMLLGFQMIEDAFKQGARCVDFMRGEGHYKNHYRMETRFNQDLLVFRNRRARLHYRFASVARATVDRLRSRLADGRVRLRKAG